MPAMSATQQHGPSWPGSVRRHWWVVVVLLIISGGVALCTGLVTEVMAPPAADGHHDFLAFHAAAQMVARGTPGELYSAAAVSGLERQVIAAPVGAAGYMPYIGPPFAAAVQAPLGLLSEPTARVVWLVLSIPVALLCCWLATTGMRRGERILAVVCLAATFPFYQAFVEGQWSFVMLAGCLVAMRALQHRRPVLAGTGLAMLALKPPLLIPVLVVLLCARAWRVAGATMLTIAAVWLITLPWTGLATQADYAGYLLAVLGSHLDGAGAAGAAAWHGAMALMEGINGLTAGYVGQEHIVLVDGVTLLIVAAAAVRWGMAARRRGLVFTGRAGRWLAVSGVAAVLLSDLHLYPQDCVLVLVALPWLLEMVSPARRLLVALAVCVLLDAVWLDQLSVAPHVLTWVLGATVFWGTRAALTQPAPAVAAEGAGTVRRAGFGAVTSSTRG